MFSVAGKVTVITGGSSGIGRAAGKRFARAGAHVILASRSDASLVAEQIGANFIQADVTSENDVHNLMEETARRHGRIDVLINNAGVFTGAVPLIRRSAEDMRRSFEVNTLGPFYGMKHAVRHMPRGGVIINTSSIGGLMGTAEYADYTASKFALNGLAMGAAIEYGPLGIRVNCICPSSVNTPMLTETESGEAEAALCRVTSSLDAIIEPEQVAALMHFLAADDCPTLTGQMIALDAGMTAGYSIAAYSAILAGTGVA